MFFSRGLPEPRLAVNKSSLHFSEGNPSETIGNLLFFSTSTVKQFLGRAQIIFLSIKIESDLTNGPLSKLLELLDTQVEGYIQWVLLEISWIQDIMNMFIWWRCELVDDLAFFKIMATEASDLPPFHP